MNSKRTSSTLSIRLPRCILVMSAALLLNFAAAGNSVAGPMFKSNLDGLQEPAPNASTATGFATFTFNDAHTELSYELSVAGLSDITMAHIHLGPPGVNGPIVLWLYPFGPPAELIPGVTSGLLSQRTVTSTDLVGTLAGLPLSSLQAAMAAGNAYVNIHTVAFAAGEIRGLIQAVSVPVPSMIPLIALGLLSLAVLHRRRRVLSYVD